MLPPPPQTHHHAHHTHNKRHAATHTPRDTGRVHIHYKTHIINPVVGNPTATNFDYPWDFPALQRWAEDAGFEGGAREAHGEKYFKTVVLAA